MDMHLKDFDSPRHDAICVPRRDPVRANGAMGVMEQPDKTRSQERRT